MKLKNYIYGFALAAGVLGANTSCSDMLDKGNDFVIYTGESLCTPADTTTSVLGIINKLQAISVRNNLLGEVRADLVKVNSNANIDLKNLANFEADVTGDSDENIYNTPRDYYAVINNCNYFLAYADSTAGNKDRNELYFKKEIAQVHSIRAWVYLQTALAYGKIPYVTEPITTKQDAEKDYPKMEIAQLCDELIKDLTPYVGTEYPNYVTIGGDIDPRMMFFPTQVVMGDLYLWKAAINHDKEAAKAAAKSYYDYIVWDMNGKKKLTTGTDRFAWSARTLYDGRYKNQGFGYTYYGSWGTTNSTDITKVPMDSAAADGYYNELRNLYNLVTQPELNAASISPTETYKKLSQSQQYYGYDSNKDLVHVTDDNFDEESLQDGLNGDLRYVGYLSKSTVKYNNEDVDAQYIRKHQSQHITIYRAQQLYLRLAEALNYAGYPRFARSILTMGLSNTVIENEVARYYNSQSDSTFFKYFDFPIVDFLPYAESYSVYTNDYGVALKVTPVKRTNEDNINMWGIHSRGCGLAFLDPDYCILAAIDSTGYPRAQEESLGAKPKRSDYPDPTEPKLKSTDIAKKPSTWDTYGTTVVTEEQYTELNKNEGWVKKSISSYYKAYVNNDSVGKYNTYITVTLPTFEAEHAVWEQEVAVNDATYEAELETFESNVESYLTNYNNWYTAAYNNVDIITQDQKTIDQAILDEQALEMVYEGNRYYDLMRRAFWYNDNSIMVKAVSQRDATVGAKLSNRQNWFLNWKGQIGYKQ